jgi:predicted TIM-barrel fold metal-dependent hydrolase
MAQKYPDQIVPFCTVIEDDPRANQMFEECLNAGAKGLKLIGWHSDYIKKHDYSLRHPSLMQIYRTASARKVPVIAHVWIGYSDTKHDYLQDLDVIMAENPSLVFVLAHFGLGFDPQSLPGLDALASKYPNLYFDTSLYGAHCELWFSRASNQAEALKRFIRAYPNQIIFGSDVFASRMKRPYEYNDALRGSVGLVELPELACPEFRKTEYFQNNLWDKYGKVDFDPYHLCGLEVDANKELDLLEKIMYGNAARILGLGEPSHRLSISNDR